MEDKKQLVDDILEKYGRMEAEKAPWLWAYEWVCEYVMHLNNSFFRKFTPTNEILNRRVFDATASLALSTMASTFVSNLWPNGARSFVLRPTKELLRKYGEKEDIKQYFSFMNEQAYKYLDDPGAGLMTTLEDYMIEQGAYGTSGIGVYDGNKPDCPIVFKVANIKDIYIDDDNYGQVDTVYTRRFLSVKQMAQEYGKDSLTENQKQMLESRKDHSNEFDPANMVEVVIAIEPKLFFDPTDKSTNGMLYRSVHIAVDERTILRESGFPELPIFVTRFYRRLNHKYGFSPAMYAIPYIFEINQLREAIITIPEKVLTPPMAVWDAGILGGNGVDLSPNVINVFSPSGYISDSSSRKPIEPLIDVGDPQFIYQHVAELAQTIQEFFYRDKLMDLSNQARVTQLATSQQDKMRTQTLGSVYSRQIQECFYRLVQRAINLLYNKGLLGVVQGSQQDMIMRSMGMMPTYIPPELVQEIQGGTQDLYDIEFISPAARILRSEELEGISNTLQVAVQLAQVDPTILDNIDMDFALSELADLNGAPAKLMNSTDQIQQIRQQRQQQQQQQQQFQAQIEGAKAMKDKAAADKMDRGD